MLMLPSRGLVSVAFYVCWAELADLWQLAPLKHRVEVRCSCLCGVQLTARLWQVVVGRLLEATRKPPHLLYLLHLLHGGCPDL